MCFLGIDTSNYTTSAAVIDNGTVKQKKKLLSVPEGGRGLRQSEALFQHVRALPDIVGPLLDGLESGRGGVKIDAVGASVRPRGRADSYMPCFLAGETTARCVASASGIPFYAFSHQQGHIAAALYSAGKLELFDRRFIAFHVSGGTTEALLVSPGNKNDDAKNTSYFPGNNDGKAVDCTDMLDIKIIAQSLDLKAGQAVDRVGVMLGLPFPAGPKMEELSLRSDRVFRIRPSMKGSDCSLSGIENHCGRMIADGEPASDIAKYCIEALKAALDEMTGLLLRQYGDLPLVFAGGVMSNSTIREQMSHKYGAFFAAPEFSSDNAAGVAVLTKLKVEGL